MLFKRIIEGKSMLNADAKKKAQEKCSRTRAECDSCGEHSAILEEMMKMVLLGVVLWAGVTFGMQAAPYPLNMLVSSDIRHPAPTYDFPFPSAENLKRLPAVTTKQINRTVGFFKENVARMQTFERNIRGYGVKPVPGSPGQALLINGYPSSEAMHYEKSALIVTMASKNLVHSRCSRYGLPEDECAGFISTLNLRDGEFGAECAALELFTCPHNKMASKYRSFDGTCNNPVKSSWGQALTGYKRLLHPRYSDSIKEPRAAQTFKKPLLSARAISLSVTSNLDKPSDKRTMALAAWSQFIYNDLVFTPVKKMVNIDESIRCCDTLGYQLIPRYRHDSCMPISVASRDPYLAPFEYCMEYTRSVTTYRGDCTFGAVEQMNQATHFLDGSHIYGSNSRDAAALREKSGGLLKTSVKDGQELLPLVSDATDKCLGGICFLAGDIRVNQNPWLTSLHTIWVLEHNRIARSLAKLNPEWRSDKLYHEARRIVVAELQHITYTHWLPLIIGKQNTEFHNSGYNPDTDPSISNTFATAVFRFFNNMYQDNIILVDDNNEETSVKLEDNYYKSEVLGRKGALAAVVRGMVSQTSQDIDLNYVDAVRNHWLGGLDSLAIDIQRGRDHGLPGYTYYKHLQGIVEKISDFQQLIPIIPEELVNKLSSIYSHVNDVDVIVGMLSETPEQDSLLGPTATYVIKDQFSRSRAGDRFFYSHSDQTGSFTKRQLIEIRKSSLARVVCDNLGVRGVARDVFTKEGESNPIVSCDEIKRVNLEAWQDSAQMPDILTITNKWLKNQVNTNSSK